MIRFNHIAPHFSSSDIARSRRLYEDVLGFSLDYADGEPLRYVVMCRDDVYVHLSHPGSPGPPLHPGACFVAVDDVEAVWAQVSMHRDCVAAPLSVANYGGGVRFNVFSVRDPDGNVLRIGEPIAAVAHEPAP